MGIQVFSPTGYVKNVQQHTEHKLELLLGKKIGYLFNQHGSARTFWEALEKETTKAFAPSAVERIYKDNTWAPAPGADIARLLEKTDYVLVGVGA